MAVDDSKIPEGSACLADKLVGIGSTVAIADNIARQPVNAPKTEWQDYTAVDTESVGGTPFAHEAAVDFLLAILVHDQNVICAGVGWLWYQYIWAVSMDFERLAGSIFLYTSY